MRATPPVVNSQASSSDPLTSSASAITRRWWWAAGKKARAGLPSWRLWIGTFSLLPVAPRATAAASTSRSVDRAQRRKGMAGARKSFSGKSLSTFRILEREGALVGCPLLETAAAGGSGSGGRRRQPIPFTVESLKLSHLLYLERASLQAALKAMPSADAAAAS